MIKFRKISGNIENYYELIEDISCFFDEIVLNED
jgi:hypothetical protein